MSGHVTPTLGLHTAVEVHALPALLQALELLPLSQVALTAHVERALVENPSLARRPGVPCGSCGRHLTSAHCPRCPGGPVEVSEDPFGTLEAAAGCEIRSDCRHVLPLVIAHLDGRGLLDADLADIAALHELPLTAVEEAVRALRVAGPSGIAERTVRDLLAAQAIALVEADGESARLVDLVRYHLPAVADDDHDEVAALLGVSREEAGRLCEVVRTRLRPSAVFTTTASREVSAAPDAFVHRGPDGGFDVEVVDSAWYGLTVVREPAAVRADPAAAAWLRPHREAARRLIRQLDIRASVLRRVTVGAVAHQIAFLDTGPLAHRDLTRAGLAEELGLHPSTVSRATAGKTLRHPDGSVIPFSTLFGTAVPVRTRIAELAGPRTLSDERIRIALAEQGYRLARRTVAKYRTQLGIPAAGRH